MVKIAGGYHIVIFLLISKVATFSKAKSLSLPIVFAPFQLLAVTPIISNS
jgi:hypothetical protein